MDLSFIWKLNSLGGFCYLESEKRQTNKNYTEIIVKLKYAVPKSLLKKYLHYGGF